MSYYRVKVARLIYVHALQANGWPGCKSMANIPLKMIFELTATYELGISIFIDEISQL